MAHRAPISTRTRSARIRRGATLLALSIGLLAGAAHAQDPLLGPGKVSKSAIRGSFVNVTNSVSFNTFDKSAELTYNPLYSISTTANMRYWLNSQINLRLGVGFSREITDNDFTTQDGEILLNDTSIGVGGVLWTIPVVNIITIAALDLRLPTSPFSQAQSMILSVQPRIILFKPFSGMAGFNMSFVTGFNDMFYEYKTASSEGAGRFCPTAALGCDPTDTGVRNVRMRLINALAAGIQPTSWVGASASVAILHDYLYPRSDELVEAFVPIEEQNTRTLMAYNLEVFFIPAPAFQLAIGASTFGLQRAPNGDNRRPFFNRNTNLVADVRINVANALAPLLKD